MAKKYSLILAPAAKRDLKKLPYNVQDLIVFEHLPAIERDPLGVGKHLFGVLKGELSYHFGRNPEYRIVYYIDNDSIIVTISAPTAPIIQCQGGVNWGQRSYIF